MMMEPLALQPLRGRDRARLVSEVPLSRWIEASCGVTFAPAERPWELEAEVIGCLNPSLNIENGRRDSGHRIADTRGAIHRSGIAGEGRLRVVLPVGRWRRMSALDSTPVELIGF